MSANYGCGPTQKLCVKKKCGDVLATKSTPQANPTKIHTEQISNSIIHANPANPF
jgi:hypothetical protein